MNKRIIYLIILIMVISGILNAQTSPEPLRNVIVRATVSWDEATNVYYYNYSVTNPAENTISISRVQIDITLNPNLLTFPDTTWEELPHGVKFKDPGHEWAPGSSQLQMVRSKGDEVVSFGSFSPSGWDIYGLSFDSKNIGLIKSNVVAAWSRWKRSVMPIRPREMLAGFRLTSYGLPGIRKMVFKPDFGQMVADGLVPEDWITQEWDPDNVLLEKNLKEESINYLAMTIGPTTLPSDANLKSFNKILQDYVSQSVQLGWLT